MIDLSQIKMIFFDVGNVFVSDDPSGCFAYEELYKRITADGIDMSPEDFFRLRTEHIQQGGGLWSFVAQYVPESEFKVWQKAVRDAMYCQWSRLSPAIKSMNDVPERLADHYRLGIIANQPRQMEDVLVERGLRQYFDVVALSDALGLHKPDTKLYEWAIKESGLPAEQTLMVGDRIDNDIIPAKKVGMKTAWLRLGYQNREWSPESDFQKHYAESIKLASYSEAEPDHSATHPDFIFTSADELLDALISAGKSIR